MPPADSPSKDAALNALAAGLAEQARSTGEPVRTTLRELRDTLEEPRMTRSRRRELAVALQEAGMEPPVLEEIGLDATLVIPLRSRLERLRQALRHPVPQLAGRMVAFVVALLAFIATIDQLLPLIRHSSPRPMTGDLNIAIARVSDGANTEAGDALADSLRRHVAQLVRAEQVSETQPDVQVHGPDRSGIVANSSLADRTRKAAALADHLDADVIAYVRIAREENRTMIIPTLYLSAARLAGAEELAGTYELAPVDVGTVPVSASTAAREEVRKAVARQVSGLLELSYGISFFAQRRWSGALRRFRLAARSWNEGAPGALVQVLRGNALGKSDDLDHADKAYAQALSIDSSFDRARLGLAEVALQRAQGGCGAGTVASRLKAALRGFTELPHVAETPSSLPGDAYSLRAWLGRGRAEVCLSQARLVDRWVAAKMSMDNVLELAAPHEGVFDTEQAEAHAGLGLAAMPTGPETPGARPAYEQARHEYAEALRLSPLPERRDVFQYFLTYIERRLAKVRP